MPTFNCNGCTLHYEVHGKGMPIILLHGLTVSFAGNYAPWGWIEKLNAIGFQVIGFDFKGHGKSGKPTDPNAYGTKTLAEDVLALLDHLKINKASFIGFSLGSIVTLHLLHAFPARCNASVLIATGDGLVGKEPYTAATVLPQIGDALDYPEFPKHLPGHIAAYWQFATDVGGDRKSAAAASRGIYPSLSIKNTANIKNPILVVSGDCDPVLGQGPLMAESFPRGHYIEIKGADHFELSAHPEAQQKICSFFEKNCIDLRKNRG